MTTRPRWRAPVALTGSHWLRLELQHCERDAGCEILYTGSVPECRRKAHRSPLVIVGVDLAGRVRKPFTTTELVVVVTPCADARAFTRASRLGAHYVVELPTGRGWLVDRLLRPCPPTGDAGSAATGSCRPADG